MSWDRLLDAGLAVVLVLALGVSAAAMDGSVTTNPDDAIDLDSRFVPVGTDTLTELKREVLRSEEEPPETGDIDERPSGGEAPTGETQQGVEAGAGTEETNSQSGDDGAGTSPTIDWWAWLLRQLLYVGLVLLALSGMVVGAVAVDRNRDRLEALFGVLMARLGLGGSAESETTAANERPPPDCPDAVSEAWYEMVCCLGLDDQRSKTPDECARAAIDAGHDPSVIRLLTDAYQCVRYGGQPVTDNLVRETRAAVARVHEAERRRTAERTDGGDESANNESDGQRARQGRYREEV